MNIKNLPVAVFDKHRLLNHGVLDWRHDGYESREGRGFVWVEKSSPLIGLDVETFQPKYTWGELRVTQKYNAELGAFGPIILEPPQDGDRVFSEIVPWPRSTIFKYWLMGRWRRIVRFFSAMTFRPSTS